VSFTPRPLYTSGMSSHPLDRRLSGPQSRSGGGGVGKIPYTASARMRTPDVQPVA